MNRKLLREMFWWCSTYDMPDAIGGICSPPGGVYFGWGVGWDESDHLGIRFFDKGNVVQVTPWPKGTKAEGRVSMEVTTLEEIACAIRRTCAATAAQGEESDEDRN